MIAEDTRTHLLIIGGGPAGNTAATVAATAGARVTLVESSIVGGAAHLWDCIPSKTMVATSVRMHSVRNAASLGLIADPGKVDLTELAERIKSISGDLTEDVTEILESQGVEIIHGFGRFLDGTSVRVETANGTRDVDFDVALISTGSAPRVPEWATIDGERILTTRDAYALDAVPEHLVVIGSGVTGVEFVHIFESLGSQVTLVVSRQQVLPHKDAEVAAVLEQDFLERGVALVKGARATGIERVGDGVRVALADGRLVEGSHALLAIGSVPLTEGVGLEKAGVETDHGYVVVDEDQKTSADTIYAAGDVTGQMPLSSVAAMQGRNIARRLFGLPVSRIDYSKVSQAVFTDPEIASVGLEEVEAAAEGRKVRITKVPFGANPRAVIEARTDGFVKIISDPATHVVLGGTIVGHRASELIGILALAVQGQIKVNAMVDTLMVHPSRSESLAHAAE